MALVRLSLCSSVLTLLVVCVPARGVEYKVVLMGGQSNMDGRANSNALPANLQGAQANVKYFNGYSASDGFTNGALVSLAAPLPVSSTQFGPEITFGKSISAADPTASYALLKFAQGGTSLYSQWKAPTAGSPGTGPVYAAFKSSTTQGLAAITSGGNTYKIVGMLWLQGESDGSTVGGASSPSAQYGTNLTNFIADVRATYGANLPFVIGGIGYQDAGSPIVSAAQMAVANADPYTVYFSNDDLRPGGNGLHFDAAGMQLIGQRFSTALQSVPEPGSIGLSALAGAAGLFRRHRRRVVNRR